MRCAEKVFSINNAGFVVLHGGAFCFLCSLSTDIFLLVNDSSLILYSYKLKEKTMSKQKLEKTVRKELELLNNQIDEKIIKGMSYAKEAKRHKFLLNSLYNLRRERSTFSWFGKALSLSKTFIF